MRRSERILLRCLVALSFVYASLHAGVWALRKLEAWREMPRHYVSREDIESRAVKKTAPVLVIRGTVDGREFELVTRGFTNYFRKETWGTPPRPGKISGGRKSGGYQVEIRTKNFSGNWGMARRGSRGSGGGGGFNQYQDDLLPGRWLWNRSGFVGAECDYEYHRSNCYRFPNFGHRDEEYRHCELADGFRIPRKIIWSTYSGVNASERLDKQRVYKIDSFEFREEPSEAWFSEQVNLYFADWLREPRTEPKSDTATNAPNG